jgi:DNA repair exonuclease SbcCD ATPase subunit
MNEELQAFLSRAKETAQSASAAAARKTNALVDSARLNIKLAQTRGEIDRRYRDIGSLVYKTHIDPETSSADLPDKLIDLERLHDEVSALEAELSAARENSVCPVCKTPYGKADSFCRSCGHAVR